jgi:hypothetical protein
MDPTLLRVTTSAGERSVRGDRPHTVGRGRGADISIDDPRVSRAHVRLEHGPDGWAAHDISSNGVWHDGRRVRTVAVAADAPGPVALRLGAADGPLVSLTVPAPARPRPAAPAEPTVEDMQTVLAGGARSPQAANAPAPPGTYEEWTPRAAAPAGAAAGGAAGAPSAGKRLAHALPTLVWLAAVGFAIGALIALS